ncbi:monooxygenase 2 [Selaginella moellendorffii]|uniref:monooxygenase 2 n=1 Tax=Selaginella moellendorffii TaxID=88036 RepID=UPI000D1C59C5|nr:monooxygenase 2 [Selaginella moellendorffii]|eukprot:XP_002976490.2 monooxygenase 2 [Selaginella moellendorffii]
MANAMAMAAQIPSPSSPFLRSAGAGARVSSFSSGGAASLSCRSRSSFTRRSIRVSVSGAAADRPAEDASGAGQSVNEVHMIVIVGAGIAGLAAALAFQRLGLQTLVLEKASDLRAGGAALTIWRNAWRALDVLGVGEELRNQYYLLAGSHVVSLQGKVIHQLSFGNCSRGGLNEVRAIERSALLEALAKPLPAGTIRFKSKVVNVRKGTKKTYNEVELEDGTIIASKVLVGCDGVRSEVAKSLGVKEPSFVGQCAIRGVADYPAGHDYGSMLLQFLGRGSRAGVVPISSTKVYWFVCFKSSSAVVRKVEPEVLKQEALEHLKSWCKKNLEEFSSLIENSPNHTVTRSALRHRWSLPLVSPSLAADGITLAGDALHPITPNLGQGGCLALEDGVILARELYNAVFARKSMNAEDMDTNIKCALDAYAKQRWYRFFPLTVKSFFIGFLSMLELWPVIYARDSFGVKVALQPDRFLKHTLYDCGELPIPS